MPIDKSMPTDPSLLAVLDRLAARGIDGQLRAGEGGELECLSCGRSFAAGDAEVDSVTRLEGVSDPDDLLAVVVVACPRCGIPGVLVAHYGAGASIEEADALVALDRGPAARPPVTADPRPTVARAETPSAEGP